MLAKSFIIIIIIIFLIIVSSSSCSKSSICKVISITTKNEDKVTHWVKVRKGLGDGGKKEDEFPFQTKAVHEKSLVFFGIINVIKITNGNRVR